MSQSFHSETVVKARIWHTCKGCGEWIPPGSYYARIAGVFEGDFYTAKLCPECEGHIDECDGCRDAMCDGWYPGDLGQWRRECERYAMESAS